MSAIHEVIVIGSGPAGYTAVLYAARAQLKPLVFEGSVTAGGALMNTTEVENFPGFPDGILGPDLMDAMRKQAERFGAQLHAEDVTEVDLKAEPKVVISEGETYLARAVIIATGSRYRELNVPGEKKLSGHGVSWCATCDGFFFREQEIAVVGGGDSAMEEALYLSRLGRKVDVVHRRDTLRASKIMQERAFGNPKISFIWDTGVADILDPATGKVEAVRLKNLKTGAEWQTKVDGLFIAIGHQPNTAIFKGQVDLHPNEYIKVVPGTTQTSVPGVFAAGDVTDDIYRQAVTAAGMGCMAAIDAERWLEAQAHADANKKAAKSAAPTRR